MSGKIKTINGKKELQAVKTSLKMRLATEKNDAIRQNLTKKLELLKK
jgi:hypothetical protein